MGRTAGEEKEEIILKLLLRSVEINFSAGRLFFIFEGLRYRFFFDWDVEEIIRLLLDHNDCRIQT